MRVLVFLTCLFACAALRAQSIYATPYTFTTLAGVAGSSGSVEGAAATAKFNNPAGVAVDRAGNVFVTDWNNHTIRKITPDGVVSTFAGTTGVAGTSNGTGAAAQFRNPFGIAIDSADNLYVADVNNHAIRKITPAGAVTTFAGMAGSRGSSDGSPGQFDLPFGVAVDSAGHVYVADRGNDTIRKITPDGVVSTFAGSPVSSGAVDANGSAARFDSPTGVAVDGAGNVYVVETQSSTVRKITPAREVTTFAGVAYANGSADGVGGGARFFAPFGVTVDAADNVYVSDTENYVIRRITPARVVTTLAGALRTGGSADGSGAGATFNDLRGLTMDNSGRLYVADYLNHNIRVGALHSGGNLLGFSVPRLVPAGATAVEARVLTEQSGGGVIVAMSGSYAVRPNGRIGSAQAQVVPDYTNPQPYNLSYVVRLLANGQPDPAFTSAPGGDGTVNAVAVQADAKILVGGTFTTFNGVLFRNLARLLPDGKADATFVLGSGVDAQVNALALQADGKILVGGAFQNFAGLPRPYLLRLGANGAIDASFSPGLNGTVNTIAIQADGKIIVGGNFTSVGGTARNRLARLLATGALDPGFDPGAGANDEVVTLAIQSDGKIIAAGDFTSFAGQSRGRIVRLLSTGAIDPAFFADAGANQTILSVALQSDGGIVLGGAFTQVNGVARTRLARLTAAGVLDAAFDPGAGPNKEVRTLLPRGDGTLLLGGLFDQFQGAPVNEVVAVVATSVATTLSRPPASITVNVGGTARFLAEATGAAPLTYQWFRDGVPIGGATEATLTLTNVTVANQGSYTLRVTSSTGNVVTSGNATLTVVNSPPSQIINLSVLTSLDTPDATFTLGFVIGGAGTSGVKSLLVRAAGPALAAFGVGNPLPDPKLEFYADSTRTGENDNWAGAGALSTLMAQVGAFPYTDLASKDAAFAANPGTASNSVVVSSKSGTGAVLAEVYDATPASEATATTPRLLNVSVLKNIPAGATLTAGFVIHGDTSKTVLIRAIGPTLAGFGVGDPMADPKLTLHRQDGTVIATNDDWSGTAALKSGFGAVGAFSLDPTTRDAALLIALQPGSYTAAATSSNATAGSALIEVYEVP